MCAREEGNAATVCEPKMVWWRGGVVVVWPCGRVAKGRDGPVWRGMGRGCKSDALSCRHVQALGSDGGGG